MKTRLIAALCLVFLLGTALQAQFKNLVLKKDESSVTYRMVHPLHKIEATSKEAQYTIEADPTAKTIKQVSAVVDVMTFDSGNSNRDSHAMEVIDAITYPDARFTGSSIVRMGDSLTVTGKLTFHGVTKDIVATAAQRWSPEKLEVVGGFDVSLTAFNIERPSLLMIPVEDKLSFTFTAVFELN